MPDLAYLRRNLRARARRRLPDDSRRLLAEAAAIANLSPLLAGSVVDQNAGLLVLSNRSEVRSVPASKRAVRGWAVDLLLVDEAAQVDDDLLLGSRSRRPRPVATRASCLPDRRRGCSNPSWFLRVHEAFFDPDHYLLDED